MFDCFFRDYLPNLKSEEIKRKQEEVLIEMAKNFYEIKVKKQIFSAIFYQYLPELKAEQKQEIFEKKE